MRYRNVWPVFVILGYFGIVVFFCNPLYNTPLYDDWAYAGNVKRLLETASFQQGSQWFRRLAGVMIGIMGVYFIMRPFWET